MDENLTVLETIEQAATEDNAGKVRSILGSFLFSNDEVEKKVKKKPENVCPLNPETGIIDGLLFKNSISRYPGKASKMSSKREDFRSKWALGGSLLQPAGLKNQKKTVEL